MVREGGGRGVADGGVAEGWRGGGGGAAECSGEAHCFMKQVMDFPSGTTRYMRTPTTVGERSPEESRR